MIHGDLSAFNILYWEGKVTLIDFPQVTLSESNHNAYRIFQRDVRRVCEYFATARCRTRRRRHRAPPVGHAMYAWRPTARCRM